MGSSPTNADEIAAWRRVNDHLLSILFFLTTGSAHLTVKVHEGTTAAAGLGDGASACAALAARFNGNTKVARHAAREKILTPVMAPGEYPTDFFARMHENRLRLQDKGETFPDESYQEIILRVLPKDCDFLRQQSYRDRAFALAAIQTTVTNMFIDGISRKSSAKSVWGCGIAMPAATNDVQCHKCQA